MNTPLKKRLLTDAECEKMDIEIQKDFNGLRTRKHLFEYIVKLGGGTMKEKVFLVDPQSFRAATDTIEQWQWWRQRTFPFDRIAAYQRWNDEMEHKPAPIKVAIVKEEISDEDIPF
ncbi:MAG: hypothetical protein ACYDAK_13285 [Candidatus Limnocylindrales bacterium]